MSQRIALFLSISLTAFVLVVVGAAISVVNPAQAGPLNPTLDPQLAAQIQAREDAYRAMIEQANLQLQPTPADPVVPTASPSPTLSPTAAYPISPDAAAAIALSAAPGSTLIKSPELVIYQSVVAYELTLNRGLVYVDANTGRILYNGAVRPVINVPAPSSGDDHESDEADD